MGFFKNCWEGLGGTRENRMGLVINLSGLVINLFGILVVLGGLIWNGHWSVVQDKKADTRNDVLATSFKEQVGLLEKTYKTETELLGKTYAKIADDVKEDAISFAQRSDKMVLGESARMVIAAQENNERAIEDLYEEATKNARNMDYIFQISDMPGRYGYRFFKTEYGTKKDSTRLLTHLEKENITKCIQTHLAEVKRGKQPDAYINMSVQKEMFWFLYRHEESHLGCLPKPFDCKFRQTTSDSEDRINIKNPEKLGVVIGYIGDLMDI